MGLRNKKDVLLSSRPESYVLVETLSEQDFLQFLTVKRGLRPASLRLLRIRFNALKKASLKLSKQDIESYIYGLRQRGLKNMSINSYIYTLREIDRYCKDRGISSGFTEGLESLERTKPLIEVLSVEEIQKILSTDLEYGTFRGMDSTRLNQVFKTMTRFLAMSGCRYSECADLLVKDVDLSLKRATLRETKNGEPRFVYLSEPLISELRFMIEGKQREQLVFTSMMGNRVVPQTFLVDLSNRARKARITKRVYPHLFRHSFATQLIASGLEISRVAHLTGHKDIQVLFDRYLHLADEQIRKSMYYHPLFRQGIEAKEILKTIVEQVKSLRIDNDSRFAYLLQETDKGVKIEVEIKD